MLEAVPVSSMLPGSELSKCWSNGTAALGTSERSEWHVSEHLALPWQSSALAVTKAPLKALMHRAPGRNIRHGSG